LCGGGRAGDWPPYLRFSFKNESPEFTETWGASNFADHFFELGEGMGSAAFPLSVSLISYSVGGIRRLSAAESFGRDLLRSQAINGLITVSMKGGINRRRPDGTRYSYPSGHTSTAFTSAGVIDHHFGHFWGLTAYSTATYVGLSRLQENKHYLTDVIAGAILGSYVAYKVTHKTGKASDHRISPFLTDRMFGARLTINL
jgi:membrane-associated phospholipid phosphatase